MNDKHLRSKINAFVKSLVWMSVGCIIGSIIGYSIFTATLSQHVDKTVKSIESQQTTSSK